MKVVEAMRADLGLRHAMRARSPLRQPLAVAMASFAAAALLNTTSVLLQQRTGFFTRRFGARGWSAHLALVLPAWTLALWRMRALAQGRGRSLPEAARPCGTLLLLVAGGLWFAAFVELGPTRTGNGNLFGRGSREPVRGGVFRLRANPMYDSYVLMLIGLALRTGKAAYLTLAGEAIVLLHGIRSPRREPPDRSATAAPAMSRRICD